MECCTVVYFYEDQLTKGINNAWMMSHISHKEGGIKRGRHTDTKRWIDRKRLMKNRPYTQTHGHTDTHTHTDKETDKNREQETKRRWRNTDTDTGTKRENA